MPSEAVPPVNVAAIGELISELVSHDAEHALLGALMISNRAYDAVSEIVRPDDFGYRLHGRIFEAIGKILDRGERVDPITLEAALVGEQSLAEAGGKAFLARLAVSAVTLLGIEDYARLIADLGARRRLVAACQDTLADAVARSPDRDISAVLADFDRRLMEVTGAAQADEPVTLAAATDMAIAAAERVYQANGAITGVTTGLVDLDRRLGGLHASDLVVLAGRPAMGKTALSLGIAEAAARAGHRAMVFELEMSATDLAARQLAAATGISAEKQRSGPLDAIEIDRLFDAGGELRPLPLIIDDSPMATVAQIRSRARREQRRRGLDLIVVDYLQLMISDKVRPENRVNEVSAMSRGLKMLAKELRVPVLALSQLSRAVEARDDKRPILSDLRDSGSIEQDADVVMFLHREEEYLSRKEPRRNPGEKDETFSDRMGRWQAAMDQWRGIAEVLIRKNRHGACRNVRVRFDAPRTRFENLAFD